MLDGDILCYIVVFGEDEKSRQWMKNNYKKAQEYFLKFHPRHTAANHGIKQVESPSDKQEQFRYYWHIPCDCNDTIHTKQTGRNLRWAIEMLEGPSEGIELLFLKHKVDTIEAYLMKEEKFGPIELKRAY